MYRPIILFVILLHQGVSALFAQTADSQDEVQKNVFVATPILFRTPETSWGFGLGAAYNFHWNVDSTHHRPSQILFAATYTLEDQILIHVPFEWFLLRDKVWIESDLGFYRYVYPYFGIGNETRVANKEFFESTFPRARVAALYALRKHLYTGLSYKFDNFFISQRSSNGLLAEEMPTGVDGAVISELALRSVWDSRDEIYYPQSGSLISLDVFRSSNFLGATYAYQGFFLDAAKYLSIADEHILVGHLQWGMQWGDVPFFQLLALGGPEFHRGYILGRYRDKRLALFQGAYRFPIYWRFKMEVFGSYGTVSAEKSFPVKHGHWSFGAGLRILVDKTNGLNLRLDYARGKDQSGIYITIGEAF
jgi:hypothetical protein